ncbi:hypothetical protein C5H24_12750, partial [Xylella fastidiosa]|uniref:hypothetical protein n=1 Tax=Xylella fastidiosa TaxID=2371 RepID=UPI001CA3CFFD
ASSSGGPSTKDVVQSEGEFKTSPITKQVIILESQDEQWQTNPWEIKSRYLDTFNYPVPDGKYCCIYEAMFTETGSSEICHTYGQKNSTISYSKTIIKMVMPIHK